MNEFCADLRSLLNFLLDFGSHPGLLLVLNDQFSENFVLGIIDAFNFAFFFGLL